MRPTERKFLEGALLEGEEKEKVLQQELVQSEKMRALGQMLAGAAHEINNPLTSILGYTQLILTGHVPENIRADLELIASEAGRCSAIIKNLVAFARKKGAMREPCDINELISGVLRMQAHQLNLNRIAVKPDLDESIPQTMADPNQLQQVFLNIINNAAHAMQDVPDRRLDVSTRLEGEVIRMTFRDSGPGIPADSIQKIFEPFFTTKETGSGTGLGLALCYSIVTDHGGKIRAEPPPAMDGPVPVPTGMSRNRPPDVGRSGQGACFIIELPVVPPPIAYAFTPEPSTPVELAAKDARILVVDDESSVVQILDRVLSNKGFRVSTAHSVDQAVELLNEDAFDLVISDYKMPLKTGADLYRHIQSSRPELAGKFILITGALTDPGAAEFIGQAPLKILEKPFDLSKLVETVGEVLSA